MKLGKKAVVTVMLGGLMVTSLVGCGKKATVESLFTDCQSAYADAKSMDMTLVLDVDGSMDVGEGTSMDLALGLNADVKAETDKGAYTSGKMTISVLGMTQEQDINTYTALEDGKQTTYSYDSEYDEWSVEEEEVDSASTTDFVDKFSSIDYSSLYAKLTLAEELTEYNGVDAYHVSGDITGNDLKEFMTQVSEALGDVADLEDYEELDLSGIVATTDFYFDKEGSKLLGVELDLSKSDFSALATSEDTEAPTFSSFKVSVTVNDVNNYTFEVPSEALESVVSE